MSSSNSSSSGNETRHRAREITLQILYQYDLDLQKVGKKEPHELANSLKRHFDHFRVPESLREFIGRLVSGTLQHLSELDQVLEKHAVNWKVSRMSPVDRSLLRLASFELLYMKDEVPPSVVIDEAVELAKDFGTSETPAFINGILDSILDGIKSSQT